MSDYKYNDEVMKAHISQLSVQRIFRLSTPITVIDIAICWKFDTLLYIYIQAISELEV